MALECQAEQAGTGMEQGVMMPGQRRGRVIAMSAGEMDAFLGEERTCRLATLGPEHRDVAASVKEFERAVGMGLRPALLPD